MRTGCAGVMIGRGAFGNPWLFQQCAAALAGDPIPPRPSLARRCDTALRQIRLAAEQKGERISRVETLEELDRITAGIQRDLRDPEEER